MYIFIFTVSYVWMWQYYRKSQSKINIFADILRVLYEIIGGDNLRSIIVVVVIITTTLSVSVWRLEVDISDLLIALHFMYWGKFFNWNQSLMLLLILIASSAAQVLELQAVSHQPFLPGLAFMWVLEFELLLYNKGFKVGGGGSHL